MALNRWIGMGRITAPLELKTTQSGVSVLSFSIAIDRDYTGQNGERTTDFINVVAWRNTAEFIEKYFYKGRMICVEGSIQTRTYEKDGQKRTATEVVAEKVHFTGEKKENPTDAIFDGSESDGFMPIPSDDDLPF